MLKVGLGIRRLVFLGRLPALLLILRASPSDVSYLVAGPALHNGLLLPFWSCIECKGYSVFMW